MSSKNVIDLRKKKPVAPSPQPQLRMTPERPPVRLQSERAARVSPLRVRRRRTRYITLGVLAFLIVLAIFGISWVSYLPQYNVETVLITGTDQVPSQDVYDYVESLLHQGGHPFLSRDNIFLYDPKNIERAIIANFPRIASATVSRTSAFSTAITVSVTERTPYALWCSDDSHTDCYEIDQTGFVFEAAPLAIMPAAEDAVASSTQATSTIDTASSTPAIQSTAVSGTSLQYIFEGGLGMATSTSPVPSSDAATSTPDSSDGTSTDDTSDTVPMQSFVQPSDPIGYTFVGAHMPGFVALLQLLKQDGFNPIGATVENVQDFRIPLTQGYYLKVSFGENPQNIVSNLSLVLSSDALAGKQSQLEYVDLRFGDKVYYKLQGTSETTTSSK